MCAKYRTLPRKWHNFYNQSKRNVRKIPDTTMGNAPTSCLQNLRNGCIIRKWHNFYNQSRRNVRKIPDTTREYIPHCNTKLRMKFISALAIQQTEVILVQDRLHRSFRKSCPAKGARRSLLIQSSLAVREGCAA